MHQKAKDASQSIMEEDITKPQNQTTNNQVDYDEGNIQTLTGLEHIRLRPGMYIGRFWVTVPRPRTVSTCC